MDDQIREQYDRLQRLSGMDIFERRGGRGEPGGYKFVCPGVALSSSDVHIEFRDGQWRLSYTESTGTYTGQAESQVCAYLALIADRMGYTAAFVAAGDDEMSVTFGDPVSTSENPPPVPTSNNGEA